MQRMLLDTIGRKHTEVSPNYKTEWCKHGPIFYYPYMHAVINQDSLIFIVKSLYLNFSHKNRWIDFVTIWNIFQCTKVTKNRYIFSISEGSDKVY